MERLTGMRRSDLDWMRIALVLAAFLLTCARALGLAGWEAGMWLWPLFLMVSAGSAWQALFLATGHPPFRARAPVPAGRHSRSGSLSSSPDRPAGRSALWRMEHRLPSRGVRHGLPGVLGTPAAAGDLPAARIVDRLCHPVLAGAELCPLLSGVPEAALIALRAMAAWALALAFLGIGVARLSGFGPAPAFLNEAALPFFLLGWLAARFIGSRLAGWPVSAGLRYAVLCLAAFAAVSAVNAVIRRLTLLRFLFGLTPLVNVVNKGGST